MTHKRAKPREFFSIQEANAMLPLIKAIVADLHNLSKDVSERRRRLSFLMAGRNPNDHDLYHEELVQIEKELDKDTRQLLDYREELRSLGVESENGHAGYVDFPSMLDGKKISLCWKLGEPELLFWHDRDAHCIQQRHFLRTESIVDSK